MLYMTGPIVRSSVLFFSAYSDTCVCSVSWVVFGLVFIVYLSVFRDVFIHALFCRGPRVPSLLCNAGVSPILLCDVKGFVRAVHKLQYILSKLVGRQANRNG